VVNFKYVERVIYSHDCSWWSCSVSQVCYLSVFIGEERERREKMKKKIGGAGGKHILSLENSSQKQNKKKEKSFGF
jgi:hypothetical protein